MKNITMPCRLCRKEVTQYKDGSGAMEIGISKWFQTIEPWNTLAIICNECGSKIANDLKFDINQIINQKPKSPV